MEPGAFARSSLQTSDASVQQGAVGPCEWATEAPSPPQKASGVALGGGGDRDGDLGKPYSGKGGVEGGEQGAGRWR